MSHKNVTGDTAFHAELDALPELRQLAHRSAYALIREQDDDNRRPDHPGRVVAHQDGNAGPRLPGAVVGPQSTGTSEESTTV